MEDYRIRVRIFTGLIVLVLGILGMRLGQLQILNTEEYTGEARSSAVRERRVQPARGAIYDRQGSLLVDNEPSYTVLLTPRNFDRERIPLLADLLEVPDTVVTNKLAEARRWSAFRPSRSFREVPFDAFSRVIENIYRLPGVSYEVEQMRRYKTEAKAAHAMGYIREITGAELEEMREEGYQQGDRIGKAGLEKRYERFLRGRLGHEFNLVNKYGLEIKSYRNGAEDTPPESGYNLYLGMDEGTQALAESLFVNKRGAAVAIDPNNGEIIAMVGKPDYDPSIFSESIDDSTWQYLTQSPEKPMFNRATMMGKPPGSTWKPFMSLLALQEGIITPTSTLPCPSAYVLGGRAFKNHGSRGYGNINVEKALEVSCNTFYYRLMMETDVNTFERYAHMFGFDQRAPTDVGEQTAGLIPDSSYYDNAYGEGVWGAGYTINLGIGQGDMVTTPMQLARYMAAVANKGTLLPPHLVRKLVHPDTGEEVYPDIPEPKEIPIKEEYFEVVRNGMRRVMENGTGRALQLPGIPSGGKTGTAQNPHGEDHSVFIMFAPFDDPQIAIGVIVENGGYGAAAAGPIASLMAEQYLTGGIADTPQRQNVVRRAMQASSEPTRAMLAAQQNE